MREAVASTIGQAVLGEGLRWDARRGEVLAVDILAGRVYRGRITDTGDLSLIRDYEVPGPGLLGARGRSGHNKQRGDASEHASEHGCDVLHDPAFGFN